MLIRICRSIDVPVHFDFVSAAQSSLPVAGASASGHHAPTADARPSIAVWLQQKTWQSLYFKKE